MSKSIFVSKTFWFNVLSFILDILVAKDVISVIPPSWLPYLAAAQAIANVALRYLTTQPVRIT